eukprot:4864872-Amphidinium_carterae.1
MILLRSHFATNYVESSSTLGDIRTMAADNDEYTVTEYALKEHYLEFMTVIEGDTKEDEIRLRQIQDPEDDMQSTTTKSTMTSENAKNKTTQKEHSGCDHDSKDISTRWNGRGLPTRTG